MANQDRPAAKNSSMIVQDMDQLQKIFNQFDANKDGKISTSELADVLRTMGTSHSQEELLWIMEDIDINMDGFINLSEFAALCRASFDDATAAIELRDAFDLYDQDKNGLISCSELHLVLNRLGMNCSEEDCARMIRSVDSDGDGNVNFEEFQKMMSANSGSVK